MRNVRVLHSIAGLDMVLSTCLEIHAIVLSGKCTTYETCAKLHRFHMLYNSRGCTPLITLIKYQKLCDIGGTIKVHI